MSKTFTNSTKCCATCNNWAGERKLLYSSSVETADPGVRGKCYANVFCSVTQGQCASDGFSCSKYQKWGALR